MGLTKPIYTPKRSGGKLPVLALILAILALGCSRVAEVRDSQTVGSPPGLREETVPRTKNVVWYRVQVTAQFLDIHVRLFAPPATTRFFLPGEWAGQSDFADAIRIGKATAPDGPRSVAIDRRAGYVEIQSADAAWIELQYRVELAAASRSHPQFRDGAVVAFGQTFLVTPPRQIVERTESIPIEVVTPSDWRVVSTWELRAARPSGVVAGHEIHGFVASDVRQLRDAFLVAGPGVHIAERTRPAGSLRVAFSSSFVGDLDEFTDFVATILRRFEADYGDVSDSVAVYVRAGGGSEAPLSGTGRLGGFVIELPPEGATSVDAQLLVAHEALHLWNGHTLVPAAASEEETRWFKEGVTHYLALKALIHSGVGDEKFALRELARIAANYSRNPLSHGQKGVDLDRTRFPYDFGVLVALALDAALYEDSGGKHGLEDWMRALLELRDLRPYTETDLLTALQAVDSNASGISTVERIWRSWVRAREPVDLRTVFAGVGLHWLPETSSSTARLVELDQPNPLYRTLFRLPQPVKP